MASQCEIPLLLSKTDMLAALDFGHNNNAKIYGSHPHWLYTCNQRVAIWLPSDQAWTDPGGQFLRDKEWKQIDKTMRLKAKLVYPIANAVLQKDLRKMKEAQLAEASSSSSEGDGTVILTFYQRPPPMPAVVNRDLWNLFESSEYAIDINQYKQETRF